MEWTYVTSTNLMFDIYVLYTEYAPGNLIDVRLICIHFFSVVLDLLQQGIETQTNVGNS